MREGIAPLLFTPMTVSHEDTFLADRHFNFTIYFFLCFIVFIFCCFNFQLLFTRGHRNASAFFSVAGAIKKTQLKRKKINNVLLL